MPSIVANKSAAWDLVGDMFWRLGRKSARPSAGDITHFLEGVELALPVAIVGASTKSLVEAALERGAAVTVLDFSAKMCCDLARALEHREIDICVHDITIAPPVELCSRFALVLSDRLVNRFTRTEAFAALVNMGRLCRASGEVRASVKLGFYDMDMHMLAAAERRGILDSFYDSATKTIDFAAAGALLDEFVLPHGDIPRDILLAWYRGRGREARFEYEDIVAVGHEAASNLGLDLTDSYALSDVRRTAMFIFRRTLG